jgi:peroxiredoxin
MKIRANPLEVGDCFPMPAEVAPTAELTERQKPLGRPVVLFFFVGAETEKSIQEILAFRDLYDQFTALNATVLGVAVTHIEKLRSVVQQHNLPFPLIADVQLKLSLAYGVARPERVEEKQAEISIAPRTVLLDSNQRVIRIYDEIDPAAHATAVLEDVRQLVNVEAPRAIIQQAPVLLIPKVLPDEFCKELIHVWETEGNEDSGFMKQIDGKTVGIYDYGHKIRRDHFIKEGPLLAKCKRYVVNRILPEMKKAYNYEVTRFEDFRIACYDASRGGYFRPHRDNTTDGTAHRRFAMSLLLNDEYEGGSLRFPEYGRHTYRPPAGGAVIFSCSLLHEATDVTAGRRFVLLSFFYGEAERKLRDEYARKQQGEPQKAS